MRIKTASLLGGVHQRQPLVSTLRSLEARAHPLNRHLCRRHRSSGVGHLRDELAEHPGDERQGFLPVYLWHHRRHRGNLQLHHEVCEKAEDSLKRKKEVDPTSSAQRLFLFISFLLNNGAAWTEQHTDTSSSPLLFKYIPAHAIVKSTILLGGGEGRDEETPTCHTSRNSIRAPSRTDTLLFLFCVF